MLSIRIDGVVTAFLAMTIGLNDSIVQNQGWGNGRKKAELRAYPESVSEI